MNNSGKRVLVTGASGFIGSHLVDSLVADAYDVSVLVRPTSSLVFLPIEKITIYYGDVRDYDSVKKAMEGCEAVFHAAATASDWGDKKDFYQINVDGTKNVLKTAVDCGVKKVVLISSNAVLGEEDEQKPKVEEAPYNPKMPYFLSNIFESDMNYYRESKMLAEKSAIEGAKQNGLDLTVIRPVWVYGPREFHAGPFEFCKTVLGGFRFLPVGKENRFHVIHVQDLVRGVMLAFNKNLTGINILNLGNDEAPKAREYFNLYCKNLNITPPRYLSWRLFYPMAFLLEVLAKLFRAQEPFLLTRSRVKIFCCNNVYDISKAKEVLGFEQEIFLEQGVKETVDWWKSHGYLKGEVKGRERLQQKQIIGFQRKLLDARMGISIFGRYFIRFLKRKITFKQYVFFVKRMFLLSDVLSYNKAVKINDVYKVHLYLPGFPGKAFYQAVDKFLITDDRTYPTTVVFSMTKACGYKCRHCYQIRDGGDELSEDKLIKLARDIQNIGVSMFDIEGGESLLRYERLLKLVRSLDDKREVWVNTTGHQLTYEKALRLKEAGLFGVMVSVHHWDPEKHDEFVGFSGAFQIACKAIQVFEQVGVTAAINCCPSQEMVEGDGVKKMLNLGKDLKCSFVQIIHEKPAGGWIQRGNTLMDKKMIDQLCGDHVELNKRKSFAQYPSLSMQVFESSHMAFGCTAGGIERFYVNAHGEIQPCEFLNVSCGNIQKEDFSVVYERMRERFKKPCLNWLCNSENCRIHDFVAQRNLDSFPVTGQDATRLMNEFQNKDEVPLYQKMRLIEKI